MLRTSGNKLTDTARMIDQPSLLRNHKIGQGVPTPQHQGIPIISAGQNASFETRNLSQSVTQRIPRHYQKAASQVEKNAEPVSAAYDDEATFEDDNIVDGLGAVVDVAPVRKVSRVSSSVYKFTRQNEVPNSRNLTSQLRTTNNKSKGDELALSGGGNESSLEKLGN